MVRVKPGGWFLPEYSQPEVEQIHREALRSFEIASVVAGTVVLGAFSDHRNLEGWVVGLSFALAGLAGLVALVGRRSTALGALILGAGLLAVGTAALAVAPERLILALLPLVSLCMIATVGLAGAVLMLAALMVDLLLLAYAGFITSDGLVVALVEGAIVFVLGCLITRPARLLMRWLWTSYAVAEQAREELQCRQGELTRALSSLQVAQNRLEQLNHELAWAREAAEEARRLKAEFAANISHELRTPLNHIIGFSQVMVTAPESYEGDVLPESYRGDIEAIYRSARHLSQLIDDVLDLSQIEAGRMGLAKSRADISEIIDEAVAVVRGFLESKRLFLHLTLPPDLPTVLVDRTRIRQVLINLLSNAARFTDEGGITITARTTDHDLIVAVSDTGPGIPPEDLPKVFEEFRQLDGSTRRKEGGSGLGLTISKKFVELHGGNMWVESEVGRGSTFFFSLPLSSTNIVLSPFSKEFSVWDRLAAEWSDEPKVLGVVSSDPSIARLVRRFLDGFNVVGIEGIAEAERLYLEDRLDALLLTASSTAEGLLHVASASSLPPSLPVVVCSLPSRRDLEHSLGVASYLVKPVNRDDLLGAIQSVGPSVRRILLIDDDPITLRLFERMIRSGSRRYRTAKLTDGAKAIDVIRATRPDVIVLDLLMPGVDGYSILTQLQADPELKRIPVIVVSARGAPEEEIVADAVAITRKAGLSVGQLTRFITVGVEALVGSAAGALSTGHPD